MIYVFVFQTIAVVALIFLIINNVKGIKQCNENIELYRKN